MKAHLFRWHKRTQLDIEFRGGFLSLGIAYWSPDATPMHPRTRGLRGKRSI